MVFILLSAESVADYTFTDASKAPLNLEVVPELEVNKMFSGSHIISFDHRTNKVQEIDFFKDGRVHFETSDSTKRGLWFTDAEGRHCIRWEKQNISSCSMIMKDDDGNWVKVKDGEIIKSYESIKPIRPKKTEKNLSIKKKLIEF